jgi:hypothetical protein
VSEDILKHLELIAAMKSDLDRDKETMRRAATEIKRLRREVAAMLAALRLVVGLADNEAVESGDCRNPDNPFAIARAAIAKATT